MDLLVGMESHSKESEVGWADVKQLLLECSMATRFMPQEYHSVAFRERKSQSCGREGTGKQPWRSQNSSVHGNLLIAIAVSCCTQHFQGGGSGSAVFPAHSLPSPSGKAAQAQGTGSTRPGWHHRAGSRKVGCPGLCRCRAIQAMHLPCPPPTLWAISNASPIFPHVCCPFILSASPRWEHLTKAQQCIAISTFIGGAAGTKQPKQPGCQPGQSK